MSLVDRTLQFSNRQTVGNVISTDVLDERFATNGLSNMPIMLQGHAMTPNNTTATVTVTLQHSDDNVTFTTLAVSKPITVAELNKGTYFHSANTNKRYLRLSYAVAGSPAGQISAWVGNMADMKADYRAVIGPGVPV